MIAWSPIPVLDSNPHRALNGGRKLKIRECHCTIFFGVDEDGLFYVVDAGIKDVANGESSDGGSSQLATIR